MKRNLDRLCPKNEIIAVKNRNFNDMSTAIHEQIDPMPLLKEEFFNDVIEISINHHSNSLMSTKGNHSNVKSNQCFYTWIFLCETFIRRMFIKIAFQTSVIFSVIFRDIY